MLINLFFAISIMVKKLVRKESLTTVKDSKFNGATLSRRSFLQMGALFAARALIPSKLVAKVEPESISASAHGINLVHLKGVSVGTAPGFSAVDLVPLKGDRGSLDVSKDLNAFGLSVFPNSNSLTAVLPTFDGGLDGRLYVYICPEGSKGGIILSFPPSVESGTTITRRVHFESAVPLSSSDPSLVLPSGHFATVAGGKELIVFKGENVYMQTDLESLLSPYEGKKPLGKVTLSQSGGDLKIVVEGYSKPYYISPSTGELFAEG